MFPDSLAAVLRPTAPLLGFHAPSALQVERVHVPAGYPVAPLVAQGLLTVSKPPASVSLTGFPNLSATSSSLRRPAIFRQVALLGFRPSRDSSSHEAPTTRRRRSTLLAFLPQTAQAPVLGGDIHGRARRYLGSRRGPFVAFRVFVLVRIDLRHQVTINVSVTDLPLLGFRLLMVCTPAER